MSYLTRALSKLRSKSITRQIKYEYYLRLNKGSSFHGNMKTSFYLSDLENVFLDFSGKNITKIKINCEPSITCGQTISELWKEGKLHLCPSRLVEEWNYIWVEFDNEYYKDGNGIHSFVDNDEQQYIYTQGEPYFLNKVVPVFDQPDLKARYRLSVVHPQDWTVIANEPLEAEFDDLGVHCLGYDSFIGGVRQERPRDFESPDYKISVFFDFKPFSSYLFAFAAGPFEKIELPAEERFQDIPMAIYYRKSLERYALAQSAYIFETSKRGIEFYQKFFGHPFPFQKWDSVYCPEFTVGAMENPGVVTYNDQLIFREERPAVSQISVSVDVILHEMAHMWFGNYVTMDWWDGLWLNESFADFVNYVCLSGIQRDLSFETEDAWSMMNARKNWGYREDANKLTHPIACEVADTRRAESIFDGITYSKGASVMKQLYYLVGDSLFRENIKNYFDEFRWSNANLHDLLRHLERGTDGLDLKEWHRQWIETAGTNSVQVEWDPEARGLQNVRLIQGALLEEHSTLRRHKLDLGFFKEDGTLGEVLTVDLLPQRVTEVELDNQGYCAVLPNHGDWAFISIDLDAVSREFFINNLPKVQEDLSKMLILRALYNDVRCAKMRGDLLVDLLLPYFEQNLLNATLVKQLGEYCLSALNYIPFSLKDANRHKIFSTCWTLISKTSQKDVLNELKKLCLSNMSSPDNLLKIHSAFEGANDQSQRLSFTESDEASILFHMIAMEGVDIPLKEACKSKLTEKASSSESLKKMSLQVNAFLMETEEREALWESQILEPSRTHSFVDLRYLLNGLGSKFQSEEKRRLMLDAYFKHLPEIVKNEESKIAETYLFLGKPHWEDLEFLRDRLQQSLEDIEHLGNEFFDNAIGKMIDDYDQILKAFELF